ncbi:MAG TPA: hypothetical protein PK575_00860 [Syntrophorhabdus sp.]|jgi:hypothetical protein|nr:MAG: hypothetical protein A4E59_01079 [Syntrophorhabdus sp. PtaB.Bin027]HQI95251.1 hypothetical protein [Syntrophorhabdus sp.]
MRDKDWYCKKTGKHLKKTSYPTIIMKDLLEGEKCLNYAKRAQVAVYIKKGIAFRIDYFVKGLQMVLFQDNRIFKYITIKNSMVISLCLSV